MIRLKFDCLDKRLKNLFYSYGIFVSRRPWPLIIVALIISTIFAAGFSRRSRISDFQYLYTPDDAPSKAEQSRIFQKWQSNFDHDGYYSPGKLLSDDGQCRVIVVAKDGGNVITPTIIRALDSLNNLITKHVVITKGPYQYNYQNLCYKINDRCYTDIDDMLGAIAIAVVGSNLTYPWTYSNLHKYYIPDILGGVVINSKNDDDNDNSPTVVSARAWLLSYQLSLSVGPEWEELSDKWRSRFVEVLRNYRDPLIKVIPYHSLSLNEQMTGYSRTAYQIFLICLLVLLFCIFLMTSSVIFVRPYIPVIDWTYSKPLAALGAVACLSVGVTSSFGLLAFMNIPYNELFLILPFVMISTTCEQVFLLINVYRSTDHSLTVDKRIGCCFKRIGPSILATTISDLACLTVASVLSTPAARLYCIYGCFCVGLTFLYMQILFLPIFSLVARLESRLKHSLCCCIDTKDITVNREIDCFRAGSRGNTAVNSSPNNFFQTKFVTILNSIISKMLIFVIFVAYSAVSAYYATTQYSAGIQATNLVPSYSYVNEYLNLYNKYFLSLPGFVRMQILVNNAPDLSIKENRVEILQLFDELKFNFGNTGSEFWLDDFDEFIGASDTNVSIKNSLEFHSKIREFLTIDKYSHYTDNMGWGDLTLGQSPSLITMFRFYIGITNFTSITNQVRLVQLARNIANKYSKFDVSTFSNQWLTVDQTLMAPWNVLMTLCGQFACIAAVNFLFIPHVIISSCTILSTGFVIAIIYGFSSFCLISLNSISTVVFLSITMVTAHSNLHIAYIYCNAESSSSSSSSPPPLSDRLRNCLAYAGWPLIQTFVTTLICVSILYTYDDYYVIYIMWRMQIFTLTISLLTSLIWLPVVSVVAVNRSWCFVQYINDMSSIRPVTMDHTPGEQAEGGMTTFVRYSLPSYSNVRLPRLSRSLNDVPIVHKQQPCFTAAEEFFDQTPLTSKTLPLTEINVRRPRESPIAGESVAGYDNPETILPDQ